MKKIVKIIKREIGLNPGLISSFWAKNSQNICRGLWGNSSLPSSSQQQIIKELFFFKLFFIYLI